MEWQVLHHGPCFEEAGLGIFNPPEHGLTELYDTEGSLHQLVSSHQVAGSLGGGAGATVLSAGRTAPDNVVVRQGRQIKLSNIHAPGGMSQNVNGINIPA